MMSSEWLDPGPRQPRPKEEVRQSKIFITTSNTTNPEDSTIMPLAESDGTLKASNYGKDVDGALQPLRVNSRDQQQVEVTDHLAGTGTAKLLGSSEPSADTETTAYTTPASTSTNVRYIIATNGGSDTQISFGVAVGGGSLGAAEYLMELNKLRAKQTMVFEGNFALSATDLIRVYSGNGAVVFSVWGTEWA